jgi:hypothetical protein
MLVERDERFVLASERVYVFVITTADSITFGSETDPYVLTGTRISKIVVSLIVIDWPVEFSRRLTQIEG